MIQRNFKLALTAGRTIPLVIPASQYDSGEQWIFTLIDETGAKYAPESGAIIGIKSDKMAILNAGTVDAAGRVVINETEQMTAAVGKNVYEILINDQTHGSANFIVMVEPRPGDNADFSDSDLSLLQQAIDGTSETAIKNGVQEWMDDNLAPSEWVIDSSLSTSGAAADAKKVGDELSALKSAIDDLESQIEGGTGSGLTTDIKNALLQLAQKVAYIDEDGQDYYDDLYDALYPPVVYTAIRLNTNSLSFGALGTTQKLTATTTPSGGSVTWSSSNTSIATVSQTGVVTSVGYGNATITATCGSLSASCSVAITQATVTRISAVFNQVGYTVYDTDSLDSLKAHLTVTAEYSNGSSSRVADSDYTLSGTLTVGVSPITVSYAGKSTTFNVTVTEAPYEGSRVITIANETLTDGFINDSGETVALANNYFIDKFYDALPFAFASNSAFEGFNQSHTARAAYYDANKNFLSRDYSQSGLIKEVSNSDAVYEKVGWSYNNPEYVFLLKEMDSSLYTNDNTYVNAEGELVTQSGCKATDLIGIPSGCDVCVLYPSLGASIVMCVFYDSSQNFISRLFNSTSSYHQGKTPISDIPTNARYFRAVKQTDGVMYHPLAKGI